VAALEVLGVTRVDIGTMEVPHKNLYEVGPVVDAMGREVLQPRSHRVGQEQREIVNNKAVVIRAA
jgi:hypothetical protein